MPILIQNTREGDLRETRTATPLATHMIFICYCFAGTIGSILSLLVLCRKSLRVQTTMFYLSALAVADLMVLYAGLVRYV